MARLIDETKIERIRNATIEMVVDKGFVGASISEIAKKAGVAEGYLYRFYKGKSELIDDLLFSNLNELMNKQEEFLDDLHTVKDIFEQQIRVLFEMANNYPERVKFLFVLMHDYNFIIQESQRNRIIDLCKRVKEKGLAMNEIDRTTNEEEIFLLGFTYPIEFINLRFKSIFNHTALGEKEIQRVLKVCINAIKDKSYE